MSETTDAGWKRLERLFEELVDLSPQERHERLETLAGEDRKLRERLESLLMADAEAESGFPLPPLRVRVEGGEQGMPRIESYRLVEPIGTGAISTVFLAERADGEYEHQVAIKLLKRGMDTDDLLARFRRERQILAELDHPNIAKILDGGMTSDGRPYFAMELIRGTNIRDHCDRSGLSLTNRLRLFRSVCGAVHYAHQRLIVHRDLKPSNIMIGEDGIPKLLDFGIAKLLNPSWTDGVEQTRTETRLLTPKYASPEQLRGESITTATDIYSLGMVLYELVSGGLPFAPGGQATRGALPTPPSAAVRESNEDGNGSVRPRRAWLAKGLAGDVDHVVLMAMREEPELRYSSAEELRQDIDRCLEGQPVIARKGSWLYRAGRFARRRAKALAAAAVLAFGLVGGLVATTRQAQVASEERRRAELERDKSQQVTEFLLNLFEASDPSDTLGEDPTARQILERGARRIERELAHQPTNQAALLNAIGTVYRKLGETERAVTLQERALDLREASYQRPHPEIADSLNDLAVALYDRGELQRAKKLQREALDQWRRVVPRDDVEIATNATNLADVLMDLGELAESERLLDEGLRLRKEALGPSHVDVAHSFQLLAKLHYLQDDLQKSQSELEEAFRIFQASGRTTADPEVIELRSSLGAVLNARGEFEEAESLLLTILPEATKVLGDQHQHVALILNNLGFSQARLGRWAAAESTFRQAYAMRASVSGRGHPLTIQALSNVAAALTQQGRSEEAVALLREAVAVGEENLGAENRVLAATMTQLGEALTMETRFDEARAILERALEIQRGLFGDDHRDSATTMHQLGVLAVRQNEPDTGARWLSEALKIRTELLGPDHRSVQETRRALDALQEN